jgi:hypothetical protein
VGSDLGAGFVLFEKDGVPNGYVLGLEDIAAPYREENESAG